jgi:hypothetical protein
VIKFSAGQVLSLRDFIPSFSGKNLIILEAELFSTDLKGYSTFDY